MAKTRQVFISHSHSDNVLCDSYVQALKSRGLDVWYDRTNLEGGRILSNEIETQLERRDAFVVLLTQAAVDSSWVRLETDAYRDLASHDPSRLMLPIRIGQCEIPLLLRGLKWIDATSLSFTVAIDQIATALGAYASQVSAGVQPPVAPPHARVEAPRPTTSTARKWQDPTTEVLKNPAREAVYKTPTYRSTASPLNPLANIRFTFLSKWTIFLLTLITIALIAAGVLLAQGGVFGSSNIGLSLIAYLVAAVVYLIAWIVALFDSIQERRWGWLIALLLLSPVLIGPLLYGFIGPRE